MKQRQGFAIAVALTVAPFWTMAQQVGPPPDTAKVPVTDIYHGVSVVDEYRWLENWDDPKVKAWVAAQNAYTQSYVNNLPQRPAIVESLKKSRQEAHIVLRTLSICGRDAFCAEIRSGEIGRRTRGFQFAGK